MWWADQKACVTVAFDKFMRAVLADVVEAVEVSLAIADAEQVFARNAKGEVVTRVLYL